MSSSNIVAITEQFVQDTLKSNDGSHDYFHIDRVVRVALQLAKAEGITDEEKELVHLAALLHDVKDWKYSGSETAGVEAAEEFLKKQNYPQEKIARISSIISMVGFKGELSRLNSVDDDDLDLLTKIVQDSDRLDAIGAIGIARTFTFGGARNRPIYDPSVPVITELTAESYKASSKSNPPTTNHFYEKLLKLKNMMKTKSGQKLAEERHQFMLLFLKQLEDETQGAFTREAGWD